MMRLPAMVTLALALALVFCGCGGSGDSQTGSQRAGDASTSSASGGQGQVDLASRIAREIEARPDQADEILERHGKTRQEFEKLLYDIAADPDLSRAYTQALGR